MRFAIVFVAFLAVTAAAPQQGLPDDAAANNTVITVDDVIDGADYTLDDVLGGRVTGLSDHWINGVNDVAFTNDGYLVGFPISVQAVLVGLVEAITDGCKYSIEYVGTPITMAGIFVLFCL